MKQFIYKIWKITISYTFVIILMIVSVWVVAFSFPISSPTNEPSRGMFMDYISKILVNSNIDTTDWTVKKAQKIINDNVNCWPWKVLQWFDSNWTPKCVTNIFSCSVGTSTFFWCASSSNPSRRVWFVRNWNERWEYVFFDTNWFCFDPMNTCYYSSASYLHYWSCNFTGAKFLYYKAWNMYNCFPAQFSCVNLQLERGLQFGPIPYQPIAWVRLFDDYASCVNFNNY